MYVAKLQLLFDYTLMTVKLHYIPTTMSNNSWSNNSKNYSVLGNPVSVKAPDGVMFTLSVKTF